MVDKLMSIRKWYFENSIGNKNNNAYVRCAIDQYRRMDSLLRCEKKNRSKERPRL
jgi:hypothetical protein